VKPQGKGGIKSNRFGKINLAVYFVAYKNLHRFDKINVSQNPLFFPNRTFTPPGCPLDFRVFSQMRKAFSLKKSFFDLRLGTEYEKVVRKN
jgi:hypothetical protein